MKEITKDNLISFCVDAAFSKNTIKHLSYKNNWILDPQESVVSIKGGNVTIIEANPKQDNIRLQFIMSMMVEAVKKYNLDLNCKIYLNLGDTESSRIRYTRFSFSTDVNGNHIPFPEPHSYIYKNHYKSQLESDIPFSEKSDKIIFFGSDTGELYENLSNQRINFSLKANGHDRVISKITNFIHFTPEMLQDIGAPIESISCSMVPITEQLKYKYILDIDGHAASWDRTLWACASNSYLVHLKSDLCKYFTWYYPFVKENNIIPIYTEDEILNNKVKYDEKIKASQKLLAQLILDLDVNLEYVKEILVRYNEIYNS